MAKHRKRQPLSEAQLEIMNVVWDQGEVTVGTVWDLLSGRRNIARNTVQTTIVRLEDKGWLKHRSEGNTHFYSAVVPRAATQKNLVKKLIDTAFEGSTEGLLMALLESESLSRDEAARIRKMIDSATRKTRKKS